MNDFQPGDIVNITVTGATITRTDDAGLTWFQLADQDVGMCSVPASTTVTVERAAPAEWPPRQRDVWRTGTTDWAHAGRLWLAGEETDDDGTADPYTPMYGDNGQRLPADYLLRLPTLTLVHRESRDGAP